MTLDAIIRGNMRVVGSCGNYVGTIERIEDGEIMLTRSHPKAGGEHHWVPLEWVESVDEVVRLNRESDQVRRAWHPPVVLTVA